MALIAERLSIRQMPNCDGVTIPERCTQALTNYTRMFQEIMNKVESARLGAKLYTLFEHFSIPCAAVSVLLLF